MGQMPLLEKQVVLVTGCSTGIGRALALELAARGHRPFATARRLESIADLAAAGIETLSLDVNDPASTKAAVETVVARAGQIDVLINNAGINYFGPILETPLEQVRDVFQTNVVGLLGVTQAVFPHMASRKSGRIVNVGSVVGLVADAVCGVLLRVEERRAHAVRGAPHGSEALRYSGGGRPAGRREIEHRRFVARRISSATARRRRAIVASTTASRSARTLSQDRPMPTEDFARELVAQAFEATAPRVIRLGTGADYLPGWPKCPRAARRNAVGELRPRRAHGSKSLLQPDSPNPASTPIFGNTSGPTAPFVQRDGLQVRSVTSVDAVAFCTSALSAQ